MIQQQEAAERGVGLSVLVGVLGVGSIALALAVLAFRVAQGILGAVL